MLTLLELIIASGVYLFAGYNIAELINLTNQYRSNPMEKTWVLTIGWLPITLMAYIEQATHRTSPQPALTDQSVDIVGLRGWGDQLSSTNEILEKAVAMSEQQQQLIDQLSDLYDSSVTNVKTVCEKENQGEDTYDEDRRPLTYDEVLNLLGL